MSPIRTFIQPLWGLFQNKRCDPVVVFAQAFGAFPRLRAQGNADIGIRAVDCDQADTILRAFGLEAVRQCPACQPFACLVDNEDFGPSLTQGQQFKGFALRTVAR